MSQNFGWLLIRQLPFQIFGAGDFVGGASLPSGALEGTRRVHFQKVFDDAVLLGDLAVREFDRARNLLTRRFPIPMAIRATFDLFRTFSVDANLIYLIIERSNNLTNYKL